MYIQSSSGAGESYVDWGQTFKNAQATAKASSASFARIHRTRNQVFLLPTRYDRRTLPITFKLSCRRGCCMYEECSGYATCSMTIKKNEQWVAIGCVWYDGGWRKSLLQAGMTISYSSGPPSGERIVGWQMAVTVPRFKYYRCCFSWSLALIMSSTAGQVSAWATLVTFHTLVSFTDLWNLLLGHQMQSCHCLGSWQATVWVLFSQTPSGYILNCVH